MTNRDSLIKAIESRHSVRSYKPDDIIEPNVVNTLQKKINEINEENPNLNFKLVLNDVKAFSGWASYGQFKGVRNYIVIAGRKGKDIDLLCGKEGEKLVLFLQSVGLNSCWVGLTYKKNHDAFEIRHYDRIRCVIALGHGVNIKGRLHKIKKPEDVSNVENSSPEWFKEGIRLALLAPTAVNQQKFHFELKDDGKVLASTKKSLAGYTYIDLGIAITHFLIGADKNDDIIITNIS